MFILSFSISLVCLVVIHSPHHHSLAQTFLSGRCPFLRALHLGIHFSLHPASSLFGTQQQLTHPPVKSSTLLLRKMPVFQGVAPRHTIFTSSCVIPLWDSATAHSPSGKELKLSALEESCFPGLVCECSHIILPGLSLVCYSAILLIKSICLFIYLTSIYVAKDRHYP